MNCPIIWERVGRSNRNNEENVVKDRRAFLTGTFCWLKELQDVADFQQMTISLNLSPYFSFAKRAPRMLLPGTALGTSKRSTN
jgi:hypothetical protein